MPRGSWDTWSNTGYLRGQRGKGDSVVSCHYGSSYFPTLAAPHPFIKLLVLLAALGAFSIMS